jgi:Holliday junction resolvase RusA-like endonuclease
MNLRFTIPGEPVAWARARLSGRVHFTPGKQRSAAGLIQVIASEAMSGAPPLEVPVAVTITAVWPWPKSMSEKKRRQSGAHYKVSKPDADNIAKLVGDALNGIVWRDDALVARLNIQKQYGLTPATHVTVEALIP